MKDGTMLTPRVLLVVLVVAQLIGYCVGQVTGALISNVLAPLWRELLGNDGLRIMAGPMDIGALAATASSALVALALGILSLGLMMRLLWPRVAKFLRIESYDGTKD